MANPYVDPSVIQPANPLQTLSSLNAIQAQRNALSLFPQQAAQAQIKTQADQLGLNQTNDQAVWQALQGSTDYGDATQRLGQIAAGGGLDVSRVTAELGNNPTGGAQYITNRLKSFQNAHDLVPQLTQQGQYLVPTAEGAVTGQPAIKEGIALRW